MVARSSKKSLKLILATNIRRLRKKKSYSQEDFAAVCGYHRTYIGAIERGERNVTLSTMEAIAKALGVSVTTLLTREDNEETK